MRVEIAWGGKDTDGEFLWLNADFTGLMDDGYHTQIEARSVTYNVKGQPVTYCDSDLSEGSIIYSLYQLDGVFNLEMSVSEDVADFDGMILESGVKAVVTYPDGRAFTLYTR